MYYPKQNQAITEIKAINQSTVTTLYRIAHLLRHPNQLKKFYDMPTTLFEDIGLDPDLVKNAVAVKARNNFELNLPKKMDTKISPRRIDYQEAANDIKAMADYIENILNVKRNGLITSWFRINNPVEMMNMIMFECMAAIDDLIAFNQQNRAVMSFSTGTIGDLLQLAQVYLSMADEGSSTFKDYMRKSAKVLNMNAPDYYLRGYINDMFVWDRAYIDENPEMDYTVKSHQDYCSTAISSKSGNNMGNVTIEVIE